MFYLEIKSTWQRRRSNSEHVVNLSVVRLTKLMCQCPASGLKAFLSSHCLSIVIPKNQPWQPTFSLSVLCIKNNILSSNIIFGKIFEKEGREGGAFTKQLLLKMQFQIKRMTRAAAA